MPGSGSIRALLLSVIGPAAVLAQSYVINTVAGPSLLDGDGKSATSVQLGQVTGLAVDSAGSLYISDAMDRRVRKVAPNGVITTVAGTGGEWIVSEEPPASELALVSPAELAFDTAGNLYISGRSALYKVAPDGDLAGNVISSDFPCADENCGGSVAVDQHGNIYYPGATLLNLGFLGPGLTIEMFIEVIAPDGTVHALANNPSAFTPVSPATIAADSAGNVYMIPDPYNYQSTVTGATLYTGPPGVTIMYADGSVTTMATQIKAPDGLALDASGDIYVSDLATQQVWKIAPDGTLRIVAGNGTQGILGDGGPATKAQLWNPGPITTDDGNLYVADTQGTRVRRIGADGSITTVAGQPREALLPVEIPLTESGAPYLPVLNPQSLAFSQDGTLYIAGSGFILKLDSSGELSVVTGSGQQTDQSTGDISRILPTSLAIDSKGDVFFVNQRSELNELTSAGSLERNIAPTEFDGFNALAFDRQDNLYFSTNSQVKEITADGSVHTIAGSPPGGLSGDGGPAVDAQLAPDGITIDSAGNVYIAEPGNGRIRKIDSAGIITTVVSGLTQPVAVKVDTAGNLYVADGGEVPPQSYACSIIEVNTAGAITRLAGTGQCDMTGDGGLSLNAALFPNDLALDNNGNIYVADTERIRKLTPVPTVLSAASFIGDVVAPGEIVSIFGSGIGPEQAIAGTVDDSGKLQTLLGGTQVFFNGIPAPLLYASATQVNAVVPYEVVGHRTAQFQIQHQGSATAPVNIRVSGAQPSVFTLASIGTGQAAALNQDLTGNNSGNPARAGSIIILFGTGAGWLTSSIDGEIVAAGNPPVPASPVSVTIGGVAADVLYAGAAPGEISGALQINARIPSQTAPGTAVPVILEVGGVRSQSGVTIAVE